jgi:hypothetical protein
MYPSLALSQITLNPELAQRLPRRLAYYHLAVPIAEDEEAITVAMVHPDNLLAVQVLEAILKSPVIPVRCSSEEITAVLDDLWKEHGEISTPVGLYWTDTPADQVYIDRWRALLSSAAALPFVSIEGEVIEVARQTSCQLIIASCSEPQKLITMLSQSPSSLFLVRGSAQPPKRILQILRGHIPDRNVLDWVIPVAHYAKAEVTVLAAVAPSVTRHGQALSSDVSGLLTTGDAATYGHILASVGIEGCLKIRQGSLAEVILEELQTQAYDIVAIAIEAYGDFVYRLLQQLSNNTSAFLLVKPSLV